MKNLNKVRGSLLQQEQLSEPTENGEQLIREPFFRKSSGIRLDHKPNITTTRCCIKSHHYNGMHKCSIIHYE